MTTQSSGSDEVELAHIEAKLQGVPPLGPGEVLIDLEIIAELGIWPGVNNRVNASPGFKDKVGKTAGRERPHWSGFNPSCCMKAGPSRGKVPPCCPRLIPPRSSLIRFGVIA